MPGGLALQGLSKAYLKVRFDLTAIDAKVGEAPNSAFIGSLMFTRDNLARERERIEPEIRQLAEENPPAAEAFFSHVDTLLTQMK